jgi:hypothetical protein
VHNSEAQIFGQNEKGVLYLQPASKKAAVLRKVKMVFTDKISENYFAE